MSDVSALRHFESSGERFIMPLSNSHYCDLNDETIADFARRIFVSGCLRRWWWIGRSATRSCHSNAAAFDYADPHTRSDAAAFGPHAESDARSGSDTGSAAQLSARHTGGQEREAWHRL